MLGSQDEAADTKIRYNSANNQQLHPDQLTSGAIVPAKRQISWGCVATSNDDLTALNGKSRSNSSLAQIVSQAQYVSTLLYCIKLTKPKSDEK
jgi:hypothetical protein